MLYPKLPSQSADTLDPAVVICASQAQPAGVPACDAPRAHGALLGRCFLRAGARSAPTRKALRPTLPLLSAAWRLPLVRRGIAPIISR
jgi:hypothetical protein